MQKKILNGVFYIIVILLIVGGVYYLINREDDTVTSDEITLGDSVVSLPEGVEIVEEGGSSSIINKNDNYILKISKEISNVTYEGGMLSVFEKEDTSILENSKYDIIFYDLGDNNDLQKWVLDWISKQEFSKDYKYRLINSKYGESYVIDVPSYGDNEKILILKKGNKILFIDASFKNPIDILNDLSLN